MRTGKEQVGQKNQKDKLYGRLHVKVTNRDNMGWKNIAAAEVVENMVDDLVETMKTSNIMEVIFTHMNILQETHYTL